MAQLSFTFRDDQVWIEQPLSDQWEGWSIESRVMTDDRGVTVIAEVRIVPTDADRLPRGGVPLTALKRVSLSEHQKLAAEALTMLPRFRQNPHVAKVLSQFEESGLSLPTQRRKQPSRRGRPSIWQSSDRAVVALIYDDALGAGRSPHIAIKKDMRVSIAIAKNLIDQARKEGKLKPAVRGKHQQGRLSRGEREALRQEARTSRYATRLAL